MIALWRRFLEWFRKDRGQLELARALREGTTRPTMAGLVLASYMQAGQLVLDTNVMAKAKLVSLAYVAPVEWWAIAYLVSGTMMAWRLTDRTPRLWWAAMSNAVMAALWVANYLAPAVVLEDTGALLSPLAIIPIGAAWVFMRTGTTARDRANA